MVDDVSLETGRHDRRGPTPVLTELIRLGRAIPS